LWLINSHNGIKESQVSPINVEDYPAIKKHLNIHYLNLDKRADKGDTPYNLRNCAYMEDFFRQKIVWAELTRTGNSFTIDRAEFLLGNTGYIMTIKKGFEDRIRHEYLIAVLNSKMMLFYLDIISTRLDKTGWRWLRQYVEQIPIPILAYEIQQDIALIVEKELVSKTEEGQAELDRIINKIYGLEIDEIKFLDSFH